MKRLIVMLTVLCALAQICPAQRTSERRPTTSSRSRTPATKIIQLAQPKTTGAMSLEEALRRRRSMRLFTGEPLNFNEIGQLAWAGQGITDLQNGHRTAPSAGSLYPIDLYFVTADGFFVYRPADHALEQVNTQDLRPRLMEATGGPSAVATAGCNIIVAGSSRKTAARFRDDARTYMYLEAGHIAQNIQLQAVAMGLGSVTIGGHDKRQTSRAVRLPTGYEAIYVIPVGRPATAAEQAAQTVPQQTVAAVPDQAPRARAVFIIPTQAFHDDELFQTQRALDLAGVETVIASKRTGPIQGMLGNAAQAMLPLNQLRVDDFNAVIFVGGTGAQEYYEDPLVHSIAREAMQKQRLIGATSMAPTILAKAGVLVGYRVTGFVSQKETLQQAGAIYMGLPVERDRNLITSSGPMAAPDFARAVTAALTQR